MKIHPMADLFPMMSEEELQELADDIKANGLLHPLVVDADGQLIDGRNRLKACKLAGVEVRTEKLDGQDPLAYIASANLARRHLTRGQQAMARAILYPEPEKGGRGKKASATEGFSSAIKQERLSVARTVLRYSEALARRVLAEPTFSLDDALEEVQIAQRKLTQHDADLERLRKSAPDLADKVEEGKFKLAEANEKLSERIRYTRQIRDDGETAVRQIEEFPAMVVSLGHAIEAGAKKLLTQELVDEVVRAAKQLSSLLKQQEV